MPKEALGRAVVLGCSGVAGSALTTHLISDAERHSSWAEIVGVSRSTSVPLEVTKRSKKTSFVVRFISADLMSSVDSIIESMSLDLLKRATHIFFCVWIPFPGDFEQECKVNSDILDNFLNAIVKVRENSNTSENQYPRVLLLEGTKSYGIHLGPSKFSDYKAPFLEDNYVRHPTPQNFYFGWEDVLLRRSWSEWAVLRPGPIFGVSTQRSSVFNLATGLSVFISLLKSSNRALVYPNPVDGSDKNKSLDAIHDMVDSKLVAAQLTFLAKMPTEQLKSKELCDVYKVPALNCSNGEPFRWRDLWPILASRCEMEYSFTEDFDFVKFISDPATVDQWAKLVDEHNLMSNRNLAEVATWPAIAGTLTRSYDCHASMEKSKKFGFTKTVSTIDIITSVFSELQASRVIPPIVINK